LDQVAPEGYRAVLGVEKYLAKAVEPTVYKLVKVRASILNGCAYCVDLHTKEALKHGETTERLFGLAAWFDSPFYDDRERAALALTDAVTKLGDHGVPDDVWDNAVKHWGEEGAGNLLLAIGTINLWNRIAITSRTPPGAPVTLH
jgi:AhpD family alkylhydroperoxidase